MSRGSYGQKTPVPADGSVASAAGQRIFRDDDDCGVKPQKPVSIGACACDDHNIAIDLGVTQMAKGQTRSTKEIRKPKKSAAAKGAPAQTSPASAFAKPVKGKK